MMSYWIQKRKDFLPSKNSIDKLLNNQNNENNDKDNKKNNEKDEKREDEIINKNNTENNGDVSDSSDYSSIEKEKGSYIYGVLLASVITKKASYNAYLIHKRSMTSPDVISLIGKTFDDLID